MTPASASALVGRRRAAGRSDVEAGITGGDSVTGVSGVTGITGVPGIHGIPAVVGVPGRPGVRGVAAVAIAAACALVGCAALTPADAPPTTSEADAVRLLEQTSFGPTPDTVAEVQRIGAARYLDAQFALSTSHMPAVPATVGNAEQVCGIGEAAKACRQENFSEQPVQHRFFVNALTEPDQLRQRTAFALSQIFVVSGRKNNRAYAMARYQQLLLDDAFVNFRQLLTDVTLSPAMGNYLDMADNRRQTGNGSAAPNENYARELLQLFTIGLVQLAPDGTVRRGADGSPLPTYGPDEIRGYARAFTGWTYPAAPGAVSKPRNPAYFDGRLIPVAAHHDVGAKNLLDGAVLPAGNDPRADLDAALDTVFRHANVGPFIARRLIQSLTTSNPSPAYVRRVAAVFDDNGHGVRGDLRAVVRATVLDPAARGDAKPGPYYGKMREPVLYITGVLRAFGAVSDGVAPARDSAGMAENVFVAPSVFNYFPPDYAVGTAAGEPVVAPELAIADGDTLLKRADFAARELLAPAPKLVPPAVATVATIATAATAAAPGSSPSRGGAPNQGDNGLHASPPAVKGTTVSFARWEPLATQPALLIDRLDGLLLHHTLTAAARDAVVKAVEHVPPADARARVATAAFLIVSGPQYVVER